MTKRCPRCQRDQPISLFAPDRRVPGGLQSHCKPCKATGERERRQRNPDHVRAVERAQYRRNPRAHKATDLKWKYGLCFDDYERMIVESSGRCAICSVQFDGPKEPALDHCHDTGAVRGLLCQRCNRAIGLFGDAPETLDSAAKYLRSHRATRVKIA